MTLNPFAILREARELRKRVESLEFAIREANDWLKAGEGVDLLYYWRPETAPTLRAMIEKVIR